MRAASLFSTRAGLIALVVLLTSVGVKAQMFEETALSSGIQQTYEASNLMGGGMAWFDFDKDGWEDVYFVGGHQSDQLYRNNGDGTFTNVTVEAGYFVETYSKNTTGVITGDLDNDGYREIFVTTWNNSFSPIFQSNLLYYNNGDGTFTEISESAGLDEEKMAMSATFVDLNQDSYLDLYVGNYISQASVIYDDENNVIGFDHACFDDDLYINNGDLTFTHVNGNYGDTNGGCTLAMTASDFDRDGDQDMMFVNDFGEWVLPNTLLENDPEGQTLTNISETSAFDVGIYGMGVAVGDFDEDQDMDYYFTNIGENKLLQNNYPDPFTEVSQVAGVVDEYSGSGYAVGWGTFFFDYNNDSYLDLFVSNGYIDAVDWLSNEDQQNNQLFKGTESFVFESATAEDLPPNVYRSRGTAYADYDKNGFPDFGVVSIYNLMDPTNDKFALYQNQANDNSWVAIQLEGTACNKDAYGAQVVLHAQDRKFAREVLGGSSHCSQNTSVQLFGLGEASQVDSVVVTWPGGDTTTVSEIPLNTYSYILQDTTTWIPPDTTGKDTTIVDTVDTDTTSTDTIITWILNRSRTPFNFKINPNPVKEQFSTEFTIARYGEAIIRLYDLSGREILVMYNAEIPAGRHTMTFNMPVGITDGPYLCVLEFAGIRESRLLLFTRD